MAISEGWEAFTRKLEDGTVVVSGEKYPLSDTVVNSVRITTHVWRGGPFISQPFNFDSGHTWGMVLAGSVSVHLLDSGEVLQLGVGDVFEFGTGTATKWEYHDHFMKYEVIVSPLAK